MITRPRFPRRLAKTCALGTLIFAVYILLYIIFLFRRQHWKTPIDSTDNTIVCIKPNQKNVGHRGGLNQHTWENNCLISLEHLCNFPIFPKAPDKRSFVENINFFIDNELAASREIDGFRLLGFLKPNISGEYLFFVTSYGFAEVWLSTNNNWENGKKIAYTKREGETGAPSEVVKSQFSNSIALLSEHRYYIEIIYVHGVKKNDSPFIQLAWKRPDENCFKDIDSSFLIPFKYDGHKAGLKVYDDDLPDALACNELRLKSYNNHMRPETLPQLESVAVNKALNFCEYKPSYLLDPGNARGFKKFHGVRLHVHKTFSFPFTNVDEISRNPLLKRRNETFTEEPLDEQESRLLVNRYIAALEEYYPGKYKLEFIKSVEKKDDPKKGSRYLLELVVKNLADGKNYILEEYVFQPKQKKASLCYPMGLQWNRTADIYLILTAKNLGRWVHHFIKNVEKIIQETKDEHLHVVIYDYDSPDIDLKQAFQRSTIKNYHYITKPGYYSRTESLSEAIQSIKNPDAIFVTIDLHLDIKSQMITDVRKHCFKGRTVYAPQIVFLHCGGSSILPKGVWYFYSYGTIAMYKQDWDNFGGFSAEYRNKTTWGGEDWDIIDGAVKGGLEIERKRSPNIYHYYHTKEGMWAPSKEDHSTTIYQIYIVVVVVVVFYYFGQRILSSGFRKISYLCRHISLGLLLLSLLLSFISFSLLLYYKIKIDPIPWA